jgi:hypothetical protein
MSTLYLTYSAVVVEDCEGAWVDGSGGDVTISNITGKVGTNCVSLVMVAGAGVELLAYHNFASADYRLKTHLVAWINCNVATNAGDLQLMLDDTNGCGTPIETLNVPALAAGVWTRICIPFATPANLSAVLSVGIYQAVDKGVCTILLDDIRAVKCLTVTQPRVVKGIDDPQRLGLNVIERQYLDFSRDEQQIGFIRHPYIDIGVLSTKADRLKAFDFFRASDKCLIYGVEELQVVNDDSSVFESVWLNETELCPSFQFSFREKTMLTTSPASWSA